MVKSSRVEFFVRLTRSASTSARSTLFRPGRARQPLQTDQSRNRQNEGEVGKLMRFTLITAFVRNSHTMCTDRNSFASD